MDDPGIRAPQHDHQSPRIISSLCARLLRITTASGLLHASVCRGTDVRLAGVVHASSLQALRLAELQETLGEGPSVSALLDEAPVLCGDLGDDPRASRWVTFSREATAAGVRSAYAFPLQIGAVCLGVLTLHGPGPVALETETMRAVVRIRDALARAMLIPGDEDYAFTVLSPGHVITNQAAGMAMAQLESTLEAAFLRLQAHAFSTGMSLTEVATEVVARRLRFSRDGNSDGSHDHGMPQTEG